MKRGFTLIELLVVIAIIGLLSSIVLSSVNQSRARARDVRRLADMRSIITALELYYQDHGKFPCKFYAMSTAAYPNESFLKPLTDGKYLTTVPVDPLQVPGGTRHYTYSTAPLNGVCGQTAVIGFIAEAPTTTPCPGGLYRSDSQNSDACYIQYPALTVKPCSSNNPYASSNPGLSPPTPEPCDNLLDQGYCNPGYDVYTPPPRNFYCEHTH